MLTIEEIRARLAVHHLTLEDLAKCACEYDSDDTYVRFKNEYGEDFAEAKLEEALFAVGYESLHVGETYNGSETQVVFEVFDQPIVNFSGLKTGACSLGQALSHDWRVDTRLPVSPNTVVDTE